MSYNNIIKFLLSVLLVFTVTASDVTSASGLEKTETSKKDKLVSSAEIISGGDLLISNNILNAALNENGNYNFDFIFKHVKPYIEAADYAVLNLETSIGGSKRGYCGYPKFNTPASVVTAAKKAGFDMFLTASNHSYDLGLKALKYKLKVIEEKGGEYIGTRKSTKHKLHKVVDVNGIKIGMLNYARQSLASTSQNPIMNSAKDYKTGEIHFAMLDSKGEKHIATFRENNLSSFYKTMKKDIERLKAQGAELIVCYPHWGREYILSPTYPNEQIAQKMCDYGVDIIIGGHPHVVQPARVYKSSISGKTTFCLHSLGNFVSSMSHKQDKQNAAYTEDGVLLKFKVNKYRSGKVSIPHASVLPIWVTRSKNLGKYSVIPLDRKKDWEAAYGLPNKSDKISSAYQSYRRTVNLVMPGINKYNKMV